MKIREPMPSTVQAQGLSKAIVIRVEKPKMLKCANIKNKLEMG